MEEIKLIYNVNEEIRNAKKIIIYGAGTSGKRLLSQLVFDGIYVDYFCDSNPSTWGTKVMNKMVISPDKLQDMKNECAVLVSSVYCEEIYESLKKLDIENIYMTHKDIFGQPKD